MTKGQTDLVLYYLAGGLVGVYALRRVSRINTFTWAGAYVMLANVVTVLVFVLLSGETDTLQIGQQVLGGVINGALSAVVTLGGYYLLGMLFNITTTLQLLDLARPTHPAMRELLLKAPGTYHHSIMVGNMAEQAAEAVGANALLARVGAYYHDIGKTVRPYFFTENQMEGSNPHDLLDPETSAQIIRSHTSDGLAMARRYRLPKAIQAFITEHHGTDKMSYFYHRAIEEYGEERVQRENYMHSGPTPQSKETAIVMLADSCEAAVRSVHPQDAEALESLINNIVSKKLSEGQLNHVPLTLLEITVVKSSFVDTLQGVFHPRVRYPGNEALAAPVEMAEEQEIEPGSAPSEQEQLPMPEEQGIEPDSALFEQDQLPAPEEVQ
jgi:putative nucleotidyltransferase with HDIG domain